MLTLCHKPGSCSLAAHIVLEESGEPYADRPVDLAAGEQRTDGFLKINQPGCWVVAQSHTLRTTPAMAAGMTKHRL
jgi:glutathione S-transferase